MADLALLACWLGLALAALVTQLLIERKKAPFPPSPFHLFRWRREVDLVIKLPIHLLLGGKLRVLQLRTEVMVRRLLWWTER